MFNFTLKDIVKEGKMSSIFPFLPFESRTTYKKCESPPFMYIPMLGNVIRIAMNRSWYEL